jgi:hypothetical protein
MKIALPVLFLLVCAEPALARYREACIVRFESQNGWSTAYKVDCNYITGSELNSATSTFKYDGFATYAVVFWDHGQATVIKLKGYFTCGLEAGEGCVTSYTQILGLDQEGRNWKVCPASLIYC